MFNENEYGLLCDLLKKKRTQIVTVPPTCALLDLIDENNRPLFINVSALGRTIADVLGEVKMRSVYLFQDTLGLSYVVFHLPIEGTDCLSVIGPFLYKVQSTDRILEISEQNGLSPNHQRLINEFYASVPVLPESSSVFLLIDSFLERMWGKDYEIINIYGGDVQREGTVAVQYSANDLDDTFIDMKNMERRYSLENEIMDAVALGSEHMVNRIFASFSESSFEKRIDDPLRNTKNYCIIMNTLLRKAAERGGVHPLYLDRTSSEFAIRVEKLSSVERVADLMADMFRSYCRLVQKSSMKNYSAVVQKAVMAIEADPSADLGLSQLATRLNISNEYLSSVFKKETGKTVTQYIRERRLKYAAHLLKYTNLQVQTVALHCGLEDVQYFSKLFKAYSGLTPTAFREK